MFLTIMRLRVTTYQDLIIEITEVRATFSRKQKMAISVDSDMKRSLKNSIMALEKWAYLQNYASYDHYDFWSSKPGVIARKLYYTNRSLGLLPVGTLYSIDVLLPQSRKLFFTKSVSAEAMSHFARGYFRLQRGDEAVLLGHRLGVPSGRSRQCASQHSRSAGKQ